MVGAPWPWHPSQMHQFQEELPCTSKEGVLAPQKAAWPHPHPTVSPLGLGTSRSLWASPLDQRGAHPAQGKLPTLGLLAVGEDHSAVSNLPLAVLAIVAASSAFLPSGPLCPERTQTTKGGPVTILQQSRTKRKHANTQCRCWWMQPLLRRTALLGACVCGEKVSD